jgi:hypothetical protein
MFTPKETMRRLRSSISNAIVTIVLSVAYVMRVFRLEPYAFTLSAEWSRKSVTHATAIKKERSVRTSKQTSEHRVIDRIEPATGRK